MAKDHHIPANWIARFSSSSVGPARERKVAVLRQNGHQSEARAAAIGYTNNLYNVDEVLFPTSGTRAVDDVWDVYEGTLSEALDRLIAGTVSAIDWIDVLVPFVAATFARDRGYRARVEARLSKHPTGEQLGGLENELLMLATDDTNLAINRVVEMERFADRVLASTWTVIETTPGLVLPDIGYGFVTSEDPDIVAPILPIGPKHLLMLVPQPTRQVLSISNGQLMPVIEHSASDIPVVELNDELAKTAQDFVVGSPESISRLRSGSLRTFGWETLDEMLAVWPFNIDTRKYMGIRSVVRDVVHQKLLSLDGITLRPYANVEGLDPQLSVVAVPSGTDADEFLWFDPAQGLWLTVHRGPFVS